MSQSSNRRSECIKSSVYVSVLALADVAALTIAVVVSLLLQFEGSAWHFVQRFQLNHYALSVAIGVPVYVTAFAAFKLYHRAWRFASLDMLGAVVAANTIGVIGLVLIQMLLAGPSFPKPVLVMLWTGGILLTGGSRVLLRIISTALHHIASHSAIGGRNAVLRRVVIIGAGTTGVRVLRSMREHPCFNYTVVGFLDDDPAKAGAYIDRVKILGPVDMLGELVSTNAVDEVLLALPQVDDNRFRDLITGCNKCKVPVKVVPQVQDVLSGKTNLQLIDFGIEDLLRRPTTRANIENIGGYVTGKRVLVTGAGGSIGSELCRQIISLRPSLLVLLGHGEYSIHQVIMRLQSEHPEFVDRLEYEIASVADEHRVNQVFEKYNPDVVFHAAAHKHVPMMEGSEQEAVQNNVLGTHHIAEACGRFGIERVVLISTDKAADPCCVMGQTKRLCEELFRAAAATWDDTRYITVRFGNVLGSRGSLLPILCDQIKRGGPVTITHPEMLRYFMTIGEAVRLVLQAGAVGNSGDLYVLDMGEPVRVLELAEDVIRLCGLQPGIDIPIEFMGVRPGEKLRECLASTNERIEPTAWDGLNLVCCQQALAPEEVLPAIRRLQNAVKYGSCEELRQLLDALTLQSLTPHNPVEHKNTLLQRIQQ